jgi:hypothetical protein
MAELSQSTPFKLFPINYSPLIHQVKIEEGEILPVAGRGGLQDCEI